MQVIIQEAPAASGGEKTAADDDKPEVVEVDEKPEVTQAEAEAEEEEAEEDEDEPVTSKKRKAAAKKEPKGKGKEPAAKKAKKEDEPRRVTINLQQVRSPFRPLLPSLLPPLDVPPRRSFPAVP